MGDFLLHEVFKPRHLEAIGKELGTDDPIYKATKLMEAEFSDLVDVMRQYKHLPHPAINSLMSLFWRIVGNNIAPVAMNPHVPTLSFWCEANKNRSLAVIMVPENWHDMLVSDTYLQMGALVFAASQAKDYWNNQFTPDSTKTVMQRAWSYEADLLHYFSQKAPKFKPDDYQQKIMKQFPKGIDSISSHYVGRDYDGVFPPYPVDTNSFK